MKIGHLDTDARVCIIAEIGNNHEGSVALAEEMIVRAAEAGADAVKFQTFRAEHYVSPANPDRFAMLRRFELTPDEFARLAGAARDAGLLFLSTPFDLGSVAVLDPLVDCFKIASGDNTFYPLIETVARLGKSVILSTGLAGLAEIRYAKALFERIWSETGAGAELAVLHCVSSYPVPPDQANLAMIPVLARETGVTMGYSDHTLGIEAAVLSVACGARIVEKHFTLDKNHSEFRDHRLSADPGELRRMVEGIRRAEAMLGPGLDHAPACEAGAGEAMRRSIVAARALPAGHALAPADITWVRPAGGLAPGREAEVLGRRLRRALEPGLMILPEDLEDQA